jgi:hypothetical protein
MRAPTPEEPSGRGLLIVDAMSDTWGIIPSSTGKTVWFALKPGVSEEAPAAADSERWKRDGGGRGDLLGSRAGDVHVSERARKRPRALALAARA